MSGAERLDCVEDTVSRIPVRRPEGSQAEDIAGRTIRVAAILHCQPPCTA